MGMMQPPQLPMDMPAQQGAIAPVQQGGMPPVDPAMLAQFQPPDQMGGMPGMMEPPAPLIEQVKESILQAMLDAMKRPGGERLKDDVLAQTISSMATAYSGLVKAEHEGEGQLPAELQYELEQEKLQMQLDAERQRMELEIQKSQLDFQLKQQESDLKLQLMREQADIKAQESAQNLQAKQAETALSLQQKQEQHEQNIAMNEDNHLQNMALQEEQAAFDRENQNQDSGGESE